MMLGLRMNEGISVSAFEKLHGVSLDSVYGKALREMESQNLVRFRNGYWMLTPLGSTDAGLTEKSVQTLS